MIARLPNEILLCIFSEAQLSVYYHKLRRIRRLRLVCSRWNSLITPLLYETIELHEKLIERLHHVCSNDDTRTPSSQARESKGIRSKSHSTEDLLPCARYLENMFACCRHLSWRGFSSTHPKIKVFDYLLTHCHKLETFLCHCNDRFPSLFCDAIQRHPQIQFKLAIDNYRGANSQFLGGTSPDSLHFPIARLVSLTGVAIQTTSPCRNLKAILSRSTQLRDIDLHYGVIQYHYEIGRFSIRAHIREHSTTVSWDWSEVEDMRLSVNRPLRPEHDENFFGIFQSKSFDSLRSFRYWNPTANDDNFEAERLRPIFESSKINRLSVIMKISLGSLACEITKIGEHLRYMTVRCMNTAEVVQLSTVCTKLCDLTIVEVDFQDQHEGFRISKAFQDFKGLQRLNLYGEPIAEASLKDLKDAYDEIDDRIREIVAHRPASLNRLSVSGPYKRTNEGRVEKKVAGLRWQIDRKGDVELFDLGYLMDYIFKGDTFDDWSC